MPRPKKSNSKQYSQNTTVNKDVVKRLVDRSGIRPGDLVYDIGAGSGTISRALLNKGARVIAVENDPELYRKCKQQLANEARFELYLDDFLIWQNLPPPGSYKVFSNIPFIRTAAIINRLLFNANPPDDCYLIVQKEAAEKYTGRPVNTLASLFINPLFWADIIYYFDRKNFFPVPSVDIVLLQFEKRNSPLVGAENYPLYRDFIVFCREGKDRTVKKSLKRLFTYPQLKQLSGLLDIDCNSRSTDLSVRQYLGIFQFYLRHSLRDTGHLVRGAEAKMIELQADRVKTHRTIKKTRLP